MQTFSRNTVQLPSGRIDVEGTSQEAVKQVSDALTAVAKVPYFSGLMLARSVKGANDSVGARFVKTRVAKTPKAAKTPAAPSKK